MSRPNTPADVLTGTCAGDDVELAALDGMLVPLSLAAPLLVVSMKANLRHAGAALSTASLTQPQCVWSA